jgi:hypothetical protein
VATVFLSMQKVCVIELDLNRVIGVLLPITSFLLYAVRILEIMIIYVQINGEEIIK